MRASAQFALGEAPPAQHPLGLRRFYRSLIFQRLGIWTPSNFVRLERQQFDAHLERHQAALAKRLERWQQDEPLPFPGWDDWDESGHAIPKMATGSR